MPLDQNKIALAMASGLSAVCATCKKYWEAQDRGLNERCSSTIRCGSPLAGDTFSDYDGPMAGGLHLWCFVCGGKSHFGIRVNGRPTVIGACKDHIRYAEQLQPIGGPPNQIEVKTSGGQLPGTYKKKSLGDAIQEVEDYYAKKEGREPE